ncbi:OPT/YSL family transporter, partial [Sulfobacillus acidophilus]|nr:OPT/YSL family transporter [Sulfobacillus acidophilus]
MVAKSTRDLEILKSLDAKDILQKTIKPYRELTAAAVILGIFQGIILNLAFVYAALKLGFSIGGSTVAAITGYALLRGVYKKGTMIENNINQTIASGINTAGTGIVFTLPALLMLNAKWQSQGLETIDFSLMPFVVAGVAGAILGVVLIIPLRKQMIELDRLRFPSGVAVTTIIRSGAAGFDKAKLLGIGFVISALWKLLMISGWLNIPGVLEGEEFNFSFGVLPDYIAPVIYLSLMNMAAGMLSGKGGLPFFIGGLIGWWLISPTATHLGWIPSSVGTAEYAGYVYSQMLRPLGIGTLVGGALMSVIVAFPALKGALKSLAQATKTAKDGHTSHDEMPLWVLLAGLVFAITLFFTASYLSPGVSFNQALLSAVVGTLWLGLAGLVVAQATGMTDISPLSGMALISVTLMMFLLGGNIAAAMIVGVAVCVAIGQAADMMQDLKTGHMLGGKPI